MENVEIYANKFATEMLKLPILAVNRDIIKLMQFPQTDVTSPSEYQDIFIVTFSELNQLQHALHILEKKSLPLSFIILKFKRHK